jgi:hypothetical protein
VSRFADEVRRGLRCPHERRWADDCSSCQRRGMGPGRTEHVGPAVVMDDCQCPVCRLHRAPVSAGEALLRAAREWWLAYSAGLESISIPGDLGRAEAMKRSSAADEALCAACRAELAERGGK